MNIRDVMTPTPQTISPQDSIQNAARIMRDADTGAIPVVDNGRPIGIITDRDIVVRALAEGKDPRVLRAEEIMTTDIHTAHPNDRVIDAIRKMGDKQVRRIRVVDRDGTLRGIISMADVALETHEDRELAEALEEISSGATFWNRIFG